MKRFYFIIVVFILGIVTSTITATAILIQEPEVVFKEAPLIVEVTVKDIKFKAISNLSTGEAWIILTVVNRIVGDCPSEILIRRGHVTSALQFLETEWNPFYNVGEHFIICLFPTAEGYSTMGLYNGKYQIEKGLIRNTKVTKEEFINQINKIRNNSLSNFPSELPRQRGDEVKNKLEKSGKISK